MIPAVKNIKCNEKLEDACARLWEGRAIIHMDLDAFFASVAQKDDPSLQGKPVIIGSKSARGVVSTASYEARTFGVHSAMSAVEAQRLCPDAHWVKPDFDRYHELSKQCIDFVYEHTPLIEQTSIDEVYADITPSRGIQENPVKVALAIQASIENLGLSASIGLSTNKTVSKMGSDFQKPRGLTIIRFGDEASFLAPLPIEKMGGIGRVTARKLHGIHITTLGELSQASPKDLAPLIGSGAQELISRAGGIDESPLNTQRETKSISNENTFAHDTANVEEILAKISRLSEKVCWRLRSENLKGRTITLKLRLADLSIKTIARTLECSTSSDKEVIQLVRTLYESSPYKGHAVRLVGVAVSNFSESAAQLSLFEDANLAQCEREKEELLLQQLDEIRKKYGFKSIGSGNHLES